MNLVIRTDASVTIGTGHAMRCLALAQAWQDAGGLTTFVMAETTPALENRLLREGMRVERLDVVPGTEEDAQRTAQIARQSGSSSIQSSSRPSSLIQPTPMVVDGYQFGADYQSEIKKAHGKLLFVDDNGHASHYAADLVLNQNVHADEKLYANREPYTRLLLGSRYVMLRREFQAWRGWTRAISPVGRKILVSMGGSDADNVTAVVLHALKSINLHDLELVVVAGGSNPHLALLERAVESSHGCRLVKDAVNMPELMAWADVAVAAAGSICWELCALALPAMLIVTASNQKQAAQRLAALGAARTLDSGSEVATAVAPILQELLESQDLRQSLSARSRELVDMDGSVRVVSALRQISDQ
jgi:UDP-2,4-diacetamido-2,4,6-trideoxy-beta-L-altropyranose hydrolase